MMQTGEQLHGFTVTRVRPVEELDATMVEMVHDVTGAELIWMDNGEDNKVFSIAFKTIPEDDTGVFHILEHTVLNGSDRYPVKEPFVELLKSSMNTFLNAMTFQDKTMYPISSRNATDYMNLVGVYLDAVFHPLIDRKPHMFLQEGWHIEKTDMDAAPLYKGVVFNEMKGATSSVDEVVEMGLNAMLYPDSPYRFVSGGDPEHIPELTYEQYVDTYRRFYHPSGSRIWLDGAVPLDEVLALIDSYLTPFGKAENEHPIPVQQVRPAMELVRYSELAATDSPEHQAQLVFGRVACSWEDKETVLALTILCDVLAGSPEAPIKRAILEAGLGQDVTMRLNDNIFQPNLMLRVHNTDDDKADAVRSLLKETVAKLVREGIDQEDLTASINQLEFQMREPHEPAGLIRNINAMSSWLYGGDPLDYLVWDEAFAAMRARIGSGYFEELLALMLDEKDLCLLRVLPSATLGEERRKAEQARLDAAMAAMTPEQVAKVVADTNMLTQWQQTPDTPEQLATLPVLSVSEVNPEPMPRPTEVSEVCGVTVLTHRLNCKGVVHLTAYFALTDGELECRTLLPVLLGKLPTAKHSAAEIQQAVKRTMGELRFNLSMYAKPDQTETCTPCLTAACSVLESRLDEAMALLAEILTATRFDDAARIRELVLQSDESNRQMVVMGGHAIAMARMASRYSAMRAAVELIQGYSHVTWLHDLAQHFDERFPETVRVLEAFRDESVCRSRLVLSVTSASPVEAASFLALLPVGTSVPETMACTVSLPEKEGIAIPSQICYSGVATHLARQGKALDGSLIVLTNIATYAWLWNEVRVKGGAYGTGLRAGGDGLLCAYSYRDPSAVNSLAAYRGLSAFVRQLCDSGEDVSKSIIAAIGETERLASPKDQGHQADADWFNGLTWEKRCERRRQMLATTRDDLRAWCDTLDAMARDGAVCVVGAAAQLEACAKEQLTVTVM